MCFWQRSLHAPQSLQNKRFTNQWDFVPFRFLTVRILGREPPPSSVFSLSSQSPRAQIAKNTQNPTETLAMQASAPRAIENKKRPCAANPTASLPNSQAHGKYIGHEKQRDARGRETRAWKIYSTRETTGREAEGERHVHRTRETAERAGYLLLGFVIPDLEANLPMANL